MCNFTHILRVNTYMHVNTKKILFSGLNRATYECEDEDEDGEGDGADEDAFAKYTKPHLTVSISLHYLVNYKRSKIANV